MAPLANFSELTRKEQVLAHLTEHIGTWVDGPALANEEVGGSEGLKRLRELRQERPDLVIKMRQHPDPERDIWQYRLVPQEIHLYADEIPDGMVEVPIEVADLKAPEPAEKPTYPRRPEPTEPAAPISAAIERGADGTYKYVPPQAPIQEELIPEPEPPETGDKFDRLPTKIDFGEVAVCPRCHAKSKRGPRPKKEPLPGEKPKQQRRRKTNEEPPADLIDEFGVALHRDPYWTPTQPCTRCNGYGIVPNKGPIALTMPTGTEKPEPLSFDEEAPTEEAFEL
jgi:hypothetical protein